MTTAARYAEMAGIIKEGHITRDEFLKRSLAEQHKLLWQWATSKQMEFQEWKQYLEAHAFAHVADAEDRAER